MKIIDPSYEILSFPENLDLIEIAGRTCYQSEPRGNPEKFVKSIVDRGHHSVIEHSIATVKIICDRGVMAELTRHRIGVAFSVESTRYCSYKEGIKVVRPSFWEDDSKEYITWQIAMHIAEKSYMRLLELGASPQEARSVLPNSLATTIIMSANFRSWMHVFKLRCSPKSHLDMTNLMRPIRNEFQDRCPAVFGGKYGDI